MRSEDRASVQMLTAQTKHVGKSLWKVKESSCPSTAAPVGHEPQYFDVKAGPLRAV